MTRARDNADLGDSFGVLGAGVTGGSGLTALGTVTAGNLSHADIVYPTGHILQTKFVSSTTSASYSSGGDGMGEAISVSNTITMSNATNKILMLTDNNVRVGVNSPNKNNMRFGLTARMAISGAGTTDIRNGPHDGTNGFYALRLSVASQELSYYGSYYPFSYLFEPDTADTEITISVFASIYKATDQSVVTNVQDGVGGHGRSQMTLMEIVST